jgi:hypothetical protein
MVQGKEENMCECPRCDADIDYVQPGDGKCDECGLLYIGIQIGDTWSEHEYQMPIWETDSDVIKAFYDVPESWFTKHELKETK